MNETEKNYPTEQPGRERPVRRPAEQRPNQRKRASADRILTILLIGILAIGCVAGGVFGFRLASENRDLSGRIEELKDGKAELEQRIAELEETNGQLTEQLNESDPETIEGEDDPANRGFGQQTKVLLNDAAGTDNRDTEAAKTEGSTPEQDKAAEDKAEETADTKPAEAAGSAVMDLTPGTILAAEEVKGREDAFFGKQDILVGDAVYNRIYGRSYQDNDNISLDELKYLKMVHYNFAHEIQVGEMIVNAAVAEDVMNIFKELFAVEYEVQSMYLIDNYWTGDGDSSDTASINVNNTSAFCYRRITGGSGLSNHAFGRAIDLNPQQNPYIWFENGNVTWYHDNASPYIDRSSGDPHVIVKGDVCYSIFEKYGYSWGGDWSGPIDYQHFEKQG